MKKLFLMLTAVVAMFATSCVQDVANDASVVVGGETTVRFSVEATNLGSRAEAAEGTYGSGVWADELYYAVYNQAGDLLDVSLLPGETPIAITPSGAANVEITLATGMTYDIVFWAASTEALANGTYTFDWAGGTMSLNPEKLYAQDETLDAFYCFVDNVVADNNAEAVPVTLRRPFAQLNVATRDTAKAAAAGLNVVETQLVVNAATELNLFTGAVDGYQTLTYKYAGQAEGYLKEEALDWLTMAYVLVNEYTTVDVRFAYNNAAGAAAVNELAVPMVPVQRNFRTNILGNILTSGKNFEVDMEENFGVENNNIYVANTDAELAEYLGYNERILYIYLKEDVSLDVSDPNLLLGGENTEEVIINGYLENTTVRSADGNRKLTLKTTAKSQLNTKNPAAKLVCKNMELTSTQTSGDWVSYNVGFKCNVELESVSLLKAMTLDGAGKTAKLTNVSIKETNECAALWISAVGQTVTIDGLNIESYSGIVIDDEGVSEVAKVTLNIANATFDTEKDAAIVVESTEGANITASELNIENTPDSDFAVWVGEETKANADEVVVNGADVTVEGAIKVATWEEFVAALEDGNYIFLTDNITYAKSYDVKKNVTIDLHGKSLEISDPALMLNIFSPATVKNGTIKGKVYARTGANIVFNGVTFGGSINGSGSIEASLQVQGACDVYAKNCTWNATNSNSTKSRPLSIQSTSSGTYRFEGCSFKSNTNQNQVYVNPISGTATLDFTNCNFNNKTPNIMLAAACPFTSLTMSGTTKLSSVTLEINRAKDVVTEEDFAYLRTLIANNSFSSVRVFYAGGSSEYIR